MPEVTSGLQTREITLQLDTRAEDDGKREVAGIGVPYDQPIEIYGIREEFAPGSVEVDQDGVMLFWRHRDPIGRVTEHRNETGGWHFAAAVSATAQGDEAYTLAKDDVVNRCSIGFEPVEHVETRHDDGTITIRHTKVLVREVSLVPFPAYAGATVQEVRAKAGTAKEETMPETITRADLDEVRSSVEDIDREFKSLAENLAAREQEPGSQYESIGHLIKAIAAGDESAKRAYETAFETRDFDGATSADTILRDGWVGSLVEVIKRRRPVLSTFATGALPASGLTVEYGVLESDTTQVGVQANEGDDLAFGKVKIGTRNAPVVTLGGWSSLSRQAIDRADVGILNVMWEALAEKYGQASEARARAVLNAAIADATATALAEVEADLTTQDGIVAAVLDLAEHFDDKGRALDGVFVDKATFKALYAVPATDRVLQVSGAPADKVGTITVQSASGNVAGLQFRLLPNAAANTVVAYDQTAIRTLEAPGAPFRLQDGNVVNLTQDFSLYGYLASFVQKRAGLVKVVAEG